MTADDHWVRWHDAYEDPNSSLSRRLAIVQARLRAALDAAAPGSIRLLSMCAGQGRDAIGVLANHPRRADVQAVVVELDPTLVATARAMANAAGLDLQIIEGDAALTDHYASVVPVDVAMVCGLFDTADGHALGVGTARFTGLPEPFRHGRRMFTFIGDGLGAHR